ncbi:glutamate 5-kinase [Sporobolomyces koalae]|uniref:glutamate 5-kinase n=1 Tax=Sporobolomyces koalae TaxID=500713 RepID=UPI0031709F09
MSSHAPHPLTIVIKLGSSSILQPTPPHLPQMATLSSIAETCVSLRQLGHRVVIVSSGAIGMGVHRMDAASNHSTTTTSNNKSTRTMGEKQALAAIGQGRLIALWDQIFAHLAQPIAQILLTRNDIADRSRYLNATTTLSTLLSMGVIPIINENDTISVSEILHINKFGDNDTLSAIAAGMCGADYLFLLTDVDSLYEDNPRRCPTARRVTKVRDIEQVRKLVSTSTLGTSLGTGGMETKLIAAELATAVGCHTVITIGNQPNKLIDIVKQHSNLGTREEPNDDLETGESVEFEAPVPGVVGTSNGNVTKSTCPHTLFLRKLHPLSSRRFWIVHGLTPRGTVYVDYGAYLAISRGERDGGRGGNGGRLLAAGVVRVEGSFAAGQAVTVAVIKNYRRRGRPEHKHEHATTKNERAKSPDHFQDRLATRDMEASVESLDLEQHSQEVQGVPEGEEEQVFEFGRGLTNYNSVEIDRVKGLRSSDIQKVLGYYEAEHVVESVVDLRRGLVEGTAEQ